MPRIKFVDHKSRGSKGMMSIPKLFDIGKPVKHKSKKGSRKVKKELIKKLRGNAGIRDFGKGKGNR